MQLTAVDGGDWAAVGNAAFGEGASSFKVNAAAANGGRIELRLDSPDGELIGTADITGTDGTYKEFSCKVENVSGTHNLFLVFEGDGSDLFDIESWQFEK